MAAAALPVATSSLSIARHPRVRWSVCALAALGTLVTGSISRAQQTPVEVGYRDFAYGNTPTPSPTGDKAQSKLWWNDGIWWGYLWSPAAGRYDIYRLDPSAHAWIDTGVAVDDRANSKADVLWDGAAGKLYVASNYYSSTPAASSSSSRWGRLYRYSYSPAEDRYTLDSGFPVVVTNGSAEVMTLAKDSNGRLWVTWVEGKVVKVNYSLSNDLQWYTPSTLPVGSIGTTASDDISAIVAFGGSQVGIMWSNQSSGIMYFTVHRDDDPLTVWQPAERVLPNCSGPCADDHISLKADSTGRVFAATKTSFTTVGSPLIFLNIRSTAGVWTNTPVGLHADHHTRPIVLLAEYTNMVFVFLSQPETGGAIYYKASAMDNISFPSGLGTLFIASSTDTNINNSTSTKDFITQASGLVVLASDSDTRRYLHNEVMAPPSNPVSVSSFSPTSGDPGTAVTINGTGFTGTTQVRFNQAAASFSVISSQQIQATLPAGATTGPITVTAPAGTASSTSSFTVTGGAPPSQIKNITFENASLVDATTGVDRVNGSVQLESGSPVSGGYSARISGASDAYLEENFTAVDDFIVTLYFRIDAMPAKDVRILQISNNGTTEANLVLLANGVLRLRVGSTPVGADTAPLTVGQVYGLRLRQKRGTGSNGIIEAFIAVGSQSFGSAFASLGSGVWTTAANRVRLGGTNGVAIWASLDDIRLTAGGQ
jgi:hypothetical protein